MLEQICAFIHNFFCAKVYRGTFKIVNGMLEVPGIMDGQYIRIIGSRFNDGIYVYPVYELDNETFEGEVWEMRPPRLFLQMVEEIENWQKKYGDAVTGPYQSESFGGYSYTLKSGTTASGQSDNAAAGWQGVYRSRLNQWRKLA